MQNKTIVLAGGYFNLNLFEYKENKRVRDFLNLIFNFYIISTINKATLVT